MKTLDSLDENNSCEYYLRYSIVESPIEIEGEEHITYGVRVMKFNIRGRMLMEVTVPDITTARSKAQDFLELIRRNSVTPMTLRYVVEDFIGL